MLHLVTMMLRSYEYTRSLRHSDSLLHLLFVHVRSALVLPIGVLISILFPKIDSTRCNTYSSRLKRSFIAVTKMIASPPKRMRIW
jgi:hypothetical protein